MDTLEPELLGLPEEPYELLELLQDVIVPFVGHFTSRFKDLDEELSRKSLRTNLLTFNFFLGEYITQGSLVSQELYRAAHWVARSLESAIHGRRIRQVLEREKLEARISSQDGCASGFVNLEDFRTFVFEIPKSRQTTINNRPILKDISIGGCELLSSQISDFSDLLWQQNPQSKMDPTASKIPQQRRMRYSLKDFETESPRRYCYNELHMLLCKHWPCSCGENHDKKLGSCVNIMLCLQSGWTHPGLAFGEFDIMLQHDLVPLCCNISIQSESAALFVAEKLDPPCQALFDGIRGMKLKIIATHVTTTDVTAEFFPDSVISEPGSCVTLQKLLEDGVILQLLGGPWLQQYWDGADISFFQFNNGNPPTFNFRRPYLSACWMTAQSRARLGRLLDGYHPMPDMVTLARFLLELELQDTRFSPKLAQDQRSDLSKASLLLQKLRDLDRDLWARALFIESMSACLALETYRSHRGQSQHFLLWEIYQKVVNPLEQNLLSMLGPRATLNDLENELSDASSPVNAILETESSTKAIEPAPQINTESDKWFKRLEQETNALMRTVKGGDINIAILDTGVDVHHPLLQNKIAVENCRDFVSNSPDICDEVGHGTHTAYLLNKTAPRAKVFCGRVWKTRREENNTGKLIAEAIKHAVEKWEVHIIVMPFAFPQRNDDIEDAVDEYSNKVLIFAAASNRSDEKLGFPACLPDVICIYSNKTPTIHSTFCKRGKEGECNFSTIGEEVEGAWPSRSVNEKRTKRETGTSCSTPIAAGVAALILEFATQTGRGCVDRAKKLKKKNVMEKVLFECMTERSTTGVYNLIQPWKLLSNLDGRQKKSLISIANTISDQINEVSPN